MQKKHSYSDKSKKTSSYKPDFEKRKSLSNSGNKFSKSPRFNTQKKSFTANNPSSKRFKLFIEYDGTRYSGWQQQQTVRTIQGILLSAAQQIFPNEYVEIYGSGRTDAGVHAICQVAHLDVNTMLAPEIIKLKFNDILPQDIHILEIEKAPKQFHARYDAVSRSYIYLISKRRTSFGKQFVWWVKSGLNVEPMRSAARIFVGKNNFASFADKDMEEKSTLVVIDAVSLTEKDDLIIIRIKGSHFLWKMVRRMVGVLVEIGKGKLSENDLHFFLNNATNAPAALTAPPSGLYLEQVLYSENDYEKELYLPVSIRNPFMKM